MSYLRRLISFVVVLIFLGYGGYFGFLNMDKVYVNVPYFGEYRVAGFLAFLASFIFGALFAAVFFGYDFFRKTFEVHQSRRALSRVHQEPHRRVSRFLEDDTDTTPHHEPSL
ncbi:LapA family protein [Oligoflexus tunisiensis]|uniref:LapA family protein n=1 Tax=Oligoflexus tunisiensis TaxID=708132 RepID=UPI00114D28CA|nr:LapA family protein [Oligoflexus tunisiensis]